MKIAVFINVLAGTDEKKNSLSNELEQVFNRYNVIPEIINISGKNIAEEIDKVKKAGFDIIAASGGDGTVSSVASCLKGSDIPLAVIPTGTLNHFAKDLNIPLVLEEAIGNIFIGEVTAIDTADVNGKLFLNNSSIGIYTHAVKERVVHQRRLKMRKWIAMFYASLRVFVRFPIYAVRIHIDGKSEVIRSPFVFIGNNEYKMDFLSLGSRDNLKKCVLSLYVAKTRTRFGILKIVAMLIINFFVPFKIFEMMLVNEVEIESRKKRIHVAIDGEVESIEPPLKYTIHPGSLKIIIPKEKDDNV